MGIPALWNMSACMDMTSGNLDLAVPMGWWATRAEMSLPFSLSLSARRTSPVPMSIPHMTLVTSMSLDSSARALNLESV